MSSYVPKPGEFWQAKPLNTHVLTLGDKKKIMFILISEPLGCQQVTLIELAAKLPFRQSRMRSAISEMLAASLLC